MDDVITYWIRWAFGIAGTFIVGWAASLRFRYKSMQTRQKATEMGVQALLRAQIIHIYNKYMERGELPIYERENIDQLVEQYKNLGGNGVIESLKEKMDALPTPRN